MITYKKLKLYRKYKGNADMFQLSAWWWERKRINGDEWQLINQLLQDLKMTNNGLAVLSYAEGVESTIRENFEDEEAIASLKLLVNELK